MSMALLLEPSYTIRSMLWKISTLGVKTPVDIKHLSSPPSWLWDRSSLDNISQAKTQKNETYSPSWVMYYSPRNKTKLTKPSGTLCYAQDPTTLSQQLLLILKMYEEMMTWYLEKTYWHFRKGHKTCSMLQGVIYIHFRINTVNSKTISKL